MASSIRKTQEVAVKIGKLLNPNDIVLLKGPMGAGKTTFTHGLVKGIGSKDHVSSPTFSLVNIYEGPGFQICHFDLYRLENEEEIEGIGFYDYLDKGNILIIEWSDFIEKYLPKEQLITISLDVIDEDTRKITFQKA